MKFVKPKSDIAFKKIFGNQQHKNILISFLNAVMRLEGNQCIEDVTIMNPYQVPKIEGLKETTLDVLAQDKSGHEFIVEMQLKDEDEFIKRSLYYTAKAYVKQLKVAEVYEKLRPVTFIGIVNFNIFPETEFLTQHLILNTKTQENHIKDFEFIFLELKKFQKEENELQGVIEEWVYFLKHAEDLTMIPKNASADVKEAYEMANQHSWTEEEMEVYEYWLLKEVSEKNTARKREEKIAKEKFSEGVEKGEVQGLEKALAKMIASGIPEVEARKILNPP